MLLDLFFDFVWCFALPERDLCLLGLLCLLCFVLSSCIARGLPLRRDGDLDLPASISFVRRLDLDLDLCLLPSAGKMDEDAADSDPKWK